MANLGLSAMTSTKKLELEKTCIMLGARVEKSSSFELHPSTSHLVRTIYLHLSALLLMSWSSSPLCVGCKSLGTELAQLMRADSFALGWNRCLNVDPGG
jgi:hypothetical protein